MKYLATLLFIVLTNITFSQNKTAKTTIVVDGVCGMCKARIEKAAITTKGVKSAVWNIKTHKLQLIYDERKTNIEMVSKNIAAVGHDTKTVKATDKAYNAISPCCKYRDAAVVNSHN